MILSQPTRSYCQHPATGAVTHRAVHSIQDLVNWARALQLGYTKAVSALVVDMCRYVWLHALEPPLLLGSRELIPPSLGIGTVGGAQAQPELGIKTNSYWPSGAFEGWDSEL